MNQQLRYYNKHISIPEVFQKVAELNGTVDEKAQLLSKYDTKPLRWVTQMMYNPTFVGGLDDLELPTEYKKCTDPVGLTPMSFASAIPKIEVALLNRKDKKTFDRHFMLVLENLHPTESDLILSILSGKKIEGVSKAVFKRTYPEFFPDSI